MNRGQKQQQTRKQSEGTLKPSVNLTHVEMVSGRVNKDLTIVNQMPGTQHCVRHWDFSRENLPSPRAPRAGAWWGVDGSQGRVPEYSESQRHRLMWRGCCRWSGECGKGGRLFWPQGRNRIRGKGQGSRGHLWAMEHLQVAVDSWQSCAVQKMTLRKDHVREVNQK